MEKVVRVMVRNGERLNPKSFTKWARQSGKMPAIVIREVIL